MYILEKGWCQDYSNDFKFAVYKRDAHDKMFT